MAKICKILLVEDQPDIQALLSELFASEGFRFIIVSDGPAMRRALAAAPEIDVVIIDMLLPGGVPGLTLANEVRGCGLPAILVTGDHSQAEILAVSGHRYLLKPFGLGAFIDLIDEVLLETRAQCQRDRGSADRAAV